MHDAASFMLRTLGTLAVASLGVVGCKTEAPAERKSDVEAKPTVDPDADRPEEDDRQANFAQPTAKPPPAPEGSVLLPEPWLYVQTCAEPNPCPSLEQPAGDAHCRELRLGGHDAWRLPSKNEVTRFNSVEGLQDTAGYHWTRTPYDEDLGQVWIVDFMDPKGAPATTIPRTRKKFRIRCVKEP
jgi:hypothetical protein